jgi:probable HAF family extracellular repeat protein
MQAAMLLVPFAGLLFAGLLQADAIYAVTDLGTLGGSSTVAFGINSSGSAVGWGEMSNGDIGAYAFGSGGSMQNLAGLAGGTDTYAYGINSSGTVVGISYINGQAHGEMWSGNQTTDLGTGVFATGINDAGEVIGGNGHAFLLANGTYSDLGVLPGGNWSSAYGINSAGSVVGYGNIGNGTFRGFVWTAGGGMQELGTFGGNNSYATAINSSGEVVGHASLASGYENAFLEVGGVMTDLGSLGGGSSYAYGINDSGIVVGYGWVAGDQNPHAFIYMNGAMLDLNALIPSGSGWELLEAYGINNAGDIVGEGLFDGQSHAFLLDPDAVSSLSFEVQPVPEPGTSPIVAIGLVMVYYVRRKQKQIIVKRDE